MIIGLTGYYSSGKSLVSYFLMPYFRVIELDQIAHQVLSQKQKEVVDHFGFSVLNTEINKIDRKRLGKIVFSNGKKLKLLESLLYPEIEKRIFELIRQDEHNKFIVSSVLYKMKRVENICDKIIFVYAPLRRRLFRGMKRDGLTKIEILRRFKRQKGLEKYIKKADFIIVNKGSLSLLKQNVKELAKFLY